MFSSSLLSFLLLAGLSQASHSPWARSRAGHSRHARAINSTIEASKFKYNASPVNASAVNAVASTWFAGWHAEDFPPENLTWSKYTAVSYAFAVTTPDIKGLNVSADDDPILKRVVELGRENDVNVTIAVGGWTGSRYFSTAVATKENRTLFVEAINDLVQHYSLDGVNFDWEYPNNNNSIGCNAVSSNDTANFLLFLQELRASPRLAKDAILTAAVGLTPFMDADGKPAADVSEFAKYLDQIEIMNYDVWGTWSETAGPNAPLNDTCATSSQQVGSAVSAVKAWTDAGFPASQIVLGVASYGHSFAVNKTNAFVSASNATVSAYPKFDATKQPNGDKWQDEAGVDVCGNEQPAGGNFDFWGLIEGGFLTQNGTAAKGIEYSFDSCSQTPSVYNATSGVFVAYDDARSFEAKGEYIVSAGLKGFAMWEAGGDYNDILLDAIRTGAGFPEPSDDDCDDEPSTPSSSALPSHSGKPLNPSATQHHYSNAVPTAVASPASPSKTGNQAIAAPTPSASATPDDGDDDDDEVDCDDDEDESTSVAVATSTSVKATATSTKPTTASATASAVPGDDDDEEDCEEEEEETDY